jgi:hypothetical protein
MSHLHKLSKNHLSAFKPPPKLLRDSASNFQLENETQNVLLTLKTDFSFISANSDYQDRLDEIEEQEFTLPLFQCNIFQK